MNPTFTNVFSSQNTAQWEGFQSRRKMTTDHVDLGEQQCRRNLAKKCQYRDVRRIQQSDLRSEGVNMGGKMITEANIQSEGLKQAEVLARRDQVTSGLHVEDLPTECQDTEDTEPTTRTHPSMSSRAAGSFSKDAKTVPPEGSDENHTCTRRPKGFRKELSGIAHELLELRLHMIKEEERLRLQDQDLVNKQVRRDKSSSGASKPEGRTKGGKSKGHEEQRKRRSPLKNQTNIIVHDLKGKVSVLLKHRREMREQDRLLRLQLDEIRAEWEESVRQLEQARIEKDNLLNKIASITS